MEFWESCWKVTCWKGDKKLAIISPMGKALQMHAFPGKTQKDYCWGCQNLSEASSQL